MKISDFKIDLIKQYFIFDKKSKFDFSLSYLIEDSILIEGKTNLKEVDCFIVQDNLTYVEITGGNNIKIESTGIIFDDNLTIDQDFSIVRGTYQFSDSLQFDVSFSSQQIQQNIMHDKLVYFQNWCNSDNLYNSDIIVYSVNSDILVNDIYYNTFNIGNYTFSNKDVFSFFEIKNQGYNIQNNKGQRFNERVKAQTKVNGDKAVEYALLSESDSTLGFYTNSKIQLFFSQYFIQSDIDGIIFNNNIKLTVGKHNIKIKQLNTPKVYYFNINVVANQFLQKGKDCVQDIYRYYQRDLHNAKLYSNYKLDSKKIDLDLNFTIK